MLVTDHKTRLHGRQNDLSDLMAIYECNYIRLRQLLREADAYALDTPYVSQAARALDLHLHLHERSRYTTTLSLTYLFQDALGEFPAPDIRVRLYHDARLAEVIACGRRRGRRDAVYDRMRNRYSLDRKWHMNRFLQKWLGYCLRQGHRFTPPGEAGVALPDWESLAGGPPR
ncbi:MAG: hypothetical protein CMN57_05435 [Gammaproteobacteria bacterium]|nr:hypothetical protein [Gammaproteobacteria bacterium]